MAGVKGGSTGLELRVAGVGGVGAARVEPRRSRRAEKARIVRRRLVSPKEEPFISKMGRSLD